ncbi:hypothetical protein [Catenulispora rubra]|uniref:hypothetical protein n=1 Tax=Catenulispora rubra TaxID=280293 RepID=UPI001E60565D|nr:hypothetical protein [Catenulispora rubra]
MTEGRFGRRGVLAALAVGGVLPALAACSGGGKHKHDKQNGAAVGASGSSNGAVSDVGGGMDVLMIIRHAEKPAGSGAPYGLTADGVQDDHSLTIQGWTRAGALVGLFDPRDASGGPVALRAGLTRPAVVAAAAAGTGGSNSKRPQETVTPLASALGVTLETQFAVGQEAALAKWLTGPTGPSGPTLVAWEHQHIADIIAGLGQVTPKPPASWPGARFDIVYVFTRVPGTGGWTFTQVPQSLLAGDLSSPIR